jgi:hypothetical protein
MVPLQNSAIEPPEALFEVELVVFGTLNRGAVRRTISVLAQTARGARRICQSRYGRVEVKRTYKARHMQIGATRDMFGDEFSMCGAAV